MQYRNVIYKLFLSLTSHLLNIMISQFISTKIWEKNWREKSDRIKQHLNNI